MATISRHLNSDGHCYSTSRCIRCVVPGDVTRNWSSLTSKATLLLGD